MSGGSSGSFKNKNQEQETAAAALQHLTMPAFQPGHQGLLAQQMSAGFGASPEANMGLLNSLFTDTQLPIINNAEALAALRKTLPEDSSNSKNSYGSLSGAPRGSA